MEITPANGEQSTSTDWLIKINKQLNQTKYIW